LAEFYADFNKFSKEIQEIFLIIADVKEMHDRRNKLMVLVFLGSLCLEFSWDRSNVIASSTILRVPTIFYIKLFLRSRRIQLAWIFLLLWSKAKP